MRIKTILLAGTLVAIASVVSYPKLTTAQAEPAASAPGSTFDQRLAQRKLERAITLEEKDANRITGRCVRAQTELRKVQTETRQLSSRRTDAYRLIDGKLWVAVGRLKLAGVDTFKLERQRASYIQNVEKFQTILKEYQQAVDDTVVVNCGSDPIGFKALLDTSRIYRTQLIAQSGVVRNIVVNEIKVTLSEHSADLQPKPATEN